MPGPLRKNPDGKVVLNVFSIRDPIFEFVCNLQRRLLLAGFEAALAAIAGVWTNKKRLPSTEEQLAWEEKRQKSSGHWATPSLPTPSETPTFSNTLVCLESMGLQEEKTLPETLLGTWAKWTRRTHSSSHYSICMLDAGGCPVK